ncbi:restriction endonuclease subunit S [Brevibacillus halotolerans]|uniref:restriction endonuclease subunit S n=1 Tax=Brevibacillus TaxID=55080 RepID=UPI00215CC1AA|nr:MULTISPECIES: restriction endonuclease subunit S [Brevibacillus]MCR8964239.1 restriction endonuclease subunit S [Brevibacillus laterosporus]MCZ0836394.1 restriction endonuclease subunit S [Brevibacillus halotolerans]
MSDKITKSPQIRFTGFTDAWELRRLGDITERVTRKNKDLESTLPLTISAQYGLVDQETFFKKVVASKDVSGYYLLMKGEFAYNKSYSKDYPWGAVKRLDLYDNGVLSTLYITFKPMKVDSDFLVCYYDTNNWHKEVAMRAAEGARNHGLLNITAADFFDTELFLPKTNSEQQKIGSFFKQLGETIILQQRKLELLKDTKKSLLQKMFPKDGANVPEIRFAGFTDAWEERKLDTILKERNVKQKISKEAPLLAFASGQGVIDRSERKTNNRDFLTKDASKKTYLLTKYDDIVYNPSNLKYGAIDRNKHGQGVISPIYITFETDEIPSFIELIVKSENFKQRALQYEEGTVTKRQSVKPENLLSLNVLLPISKDEQLKIGKFFEQLDNTIDLCHRELNSLEKLKKSLLQQMFV